MVEFIKVKTRVLQPPKDDLLAVFCDYLPKIQDKDIILISSKVLAIHQGRCIKKDKCSKLELISNEADVVLGELNDPCVTIKECTMIPNSGIDESNGDGYYVLWPANIGNLLKEIYFFLKNKFCLMNLGIISVDSHILPMRLGSTGISQGSYGFVPISDQVGKKDLFGRELIMSRINIVDCLAGITPLLMGEGNESCPIVIARGLEGIVFDDVVGDISIAPEQDIFKGAFKC